MGQPTVEIYTDGACSGNPGPGGWGVVLRYGTHERELHGGDPGPTTNNRMELMAAIQALETLTRRSVVRLYTDSSYVRNGVLSWVATWKRNGWRTSAKTPVKNEDLWRRLDTAAQRHDIEWHWVKGHAGHPENERADRLAVLGVKEAATMPPAPRKLVPSPHSALPLKEPAKAEYRPDDTECVHEMPASWCALCKPLPPGVLPRGYRVAGNAYHNDPECDWLRKGQRYAARLGKQTHEVVPIAWAGVAPGELEPCEACCTVEWVRRHGR